MDWSFTIVLRQSGGMGGIVWPCRVHIQTYSRLAVASSQRVLEADQMQCGGSCLAIYLIKRSGRVLYSVDYWQCIESSGFLSCREHVHIVCVKCFLEGEVGKRSWNHIWLSKVRCVGGCVEGCDRWALYVEMYGYDCMIE